MRLIFTLSFLILSMWCMAQPSGGGPGGTPTPIGFTEVLVIGAIGLGAVKKIKEN